MSIGDFRWHHAVIATLRHSTLPGFEASAAELDSVPLTDISSLGTRDRLSLLAQFAAHQGLLQFGGISDLDVDPAEWAVVQKRGSDCRLVRVGARRSDAAEAPPTLTLAQQFAELVRAPKLDILGQSWARAESIYIEAWRRLRDDASADLRWAIQSAAGRILSPGPDAFATISAEPGRYSYMDPGCVESLRAFARTDDSIRLVEIGDGSPLHRYSALGALHDRIPNFGALTETEMAERLVDLSVQQRTFFLVLDDHSIDSASREVIAIASRAGSGSWIVPGTESTLPRTRTFLVSPTLEARRRAEERLRDVPSPDQYIDEILTTDNLDRFLFSGQLPPASSSRTVEEPRRSYVAALALLGTRVPIATAREYLSEFGFGHELEQLVVPGIATVDADDYVFVSEAERELMASLIPAASRVALARVAARFVEGGTRAMLLLDAGETDEAIRLLECVEEQDPERLLTLLKRFPRALVASSPTLMRRFAAASIDCGHYRQACEIASRLEDSEQRAFLIARAERRMGDYSSALTRLDSVVVASPSAQVLRGELLSQLGRYNEAETVFANCRPVSESDRALLTYHRGIMAIDRGVANFSPAEAGATSDSYLRARLQTYLSLHAEDFVAAENSAAEAVAQSRFVCERVDAILDHIFTLFSAGRWREARVEALAALTIVEETQGDRAAGGILFTLAYLAADDGQWVHASQRIQRLRHFYTTTRDDRRVREIDLLSAHFAFCRGRFTEARQGALTVLELRVAPPIREAAALIIDEIDWIRGIDAPLRSRGDARNLELNMRHRVMRVRRGAQEEIDDPFRRALLAWEKSPNGEAPAATERGQSLALFRSAMATRRDDVAGAIAKALDLTIERADATASAASTELRVLQMVASAEFPLTATALGPVQWRYAVQNRLGHWIEQGSLPSLRGDELDRIAAAPSAHWIACGERELLFIEGVDEWSPQSREAIAALFRTRVENARLRRLFEADEEVAAPTAPLDGIVGSSAPMREVQDVITRVARRDVPVCILGESGTGKELLARSVHRLSARRHKPFTAVNCAALPESLLESELFGHARGAFTGADRDRPGVIESTDGGTLFLDEIGEMSLSAQAKLLRFLQEGEFRRVGEAANRSADVRVVAATNRHLERAVEEGRFREDLYYRVRGIEVTLPPLRDRVVDIPMLTQHFVTVEREKHRGGPSRVSQDVELVFAAYRWPGNVRELQNTIRAAHAIAGEARQIDLDHLPDRLRGVVVTRPARGGSYHDAVSKFRRDLIEKSLLQAQGNQNQAAALLNISRQALAYQIRELGIMVGKSPRV